MDMGGAMKKAAKTIILMILLYAVSCNGPVVEKGIRYVLHPKLEDGIHHLAYEAVTRLDELCRESGIDLAPPTIQQQKVIITGVDGDQGPQLLDIIKTHFPDWRADSLSNQVVMSLNEDVAERLQIQMMSQTMAALKKRLTKRADLYPVLQQLGTPPKARILVTLITDKDIAVYNLFFSQGILQFCQVVDGPFGSKDELEAKYSQGIGADQKAVPSKNRQWYLIRRWPVVSGRDIEMAKSDMDQYASPSVGIIFNDHGAKKLEVFSQNHIGQRLAIVLDGYIYSAPRLESRISRYVSITGQFSEAEVADLVDILQSGALPVPLKLLEERKIEGELELKQGFVMEFSLDAPSSMTQVRQKLDQIKLDHYMLQQAEGGHFFLNLTKVNGEGAKNELIQKLSNALGNYKMVSIEFLSSPIKI